jgi:hypothetical protein
VPVSGASPRAVAELESLVWGGGRLDEGSREECWEESVPPVMGPVGLGLLGSLRWVEVWLGLSVRVGVLEEEEV